MRYHQVGSDESESQETVTVKQICVVKEKTRDKYILLVIYEIAIRMYRKMRDIMRRY